MRIIAITNQKGGTGKTTMAINLGTALASMRKKVLLIDLDPQANLSYSFGITSPDSSMVDVLQAKHTIHTILTKREGLDIAPGSNKLADLELSLVNRTGRESVLRDRLTDLRGYDYVFIDCPPSLSVLTLNALNMAHEVIIPLQMEIFALQGLSQLLATIKEVKQVLNKSLRIGGIVPTMYDGRRRLSDEVLTHLREGVKDKVFKTAIRECVKIAEAPSFGKSVLAYAPKSRGAEDFMGLAKEFIRERR